MGDYPPQYYSPRARKYYRTRPSVAGGGGGSSWDYDDDFSTNIGWTCVGTGNQIDTSNSQLDFQLTRGNTFGGSYISTTNSNVFGSSVSNTAYIIRFHAMRYSSISSTYAYNPFLQVQRDGGDHSEDNDDALSSWCQTTASGTPKFGAMTNDDGTRTNSMGNTTWSTGTDYFIENIRNSATEMRSTRSSSDSFTADEHDITFTIPSTIQALSYITIQADYAGSMSTRTNIGTIDRIQGMNGVNTPP